MEKLKILSGIGLALAFSQVGAGAITDIGIEAVSKTERVVKITFDGQAPKPSSFATANPPRVALDFAGTTVKLPQSQITTNDAVVRMATAAQNNGRSRVLLNLAENANYTTEVEGNVVLVRIGSKSADLAYNTAPKEVITQNYASTPVSAATGGSSFSAAKPTAIDFRRTEKGAGRLEIALPTKDIPIDVNRVGDKLVVSLLGAQIPPQLLRKYDVNDFATPAKKVDVYNDGRNGKVVLNTKGDWTFASYQTADKLVVELTEKQMDPFGRSVLGQDTFSGNKLSLNFQNVEVRTVLQVIAEFTKLNIVVSDQVAGNMTLRLTDVPWDQALNLILESKGLVQHREGNIIRIETTAEFHKRVAELDAANSSGELIQRIFRLKYKDVNTLKDVLKITDSSSSSNSSRSLLSNRGSAIIDPGTNTLVINDVRSVVQKMEYLISELDVAKKQVMVEARIVEASDDFNRSFGVKFGAARIGKTSMGSDFEQSWNNNQRSADFKGTIKPNVSLPGGSATSGGVMGIFHAWSSYAIGLELSAAQANGTTRTVSSPRIMMADREEGEIKEGYEIPFETATSSGATSITLKEATTSLKVKPQITPDGNIIMEVEVNKDSPNKGPTGEAALAVRSIKTKATVENGGTVVIGGIYVQEESNTETKVPFLGDIPILGRLFKKTENSNKRRELLVFLTPHILADVDAQARYQ